MNESGSFDRDAFVRLGRSVRNFFLAFDAFVNALFNRDAWARFGRRAFKRAILIVLVGFAFAAITWTYSTEIFQWMLIPAEGQLTPFEGGLPVFTGPADMFAVTVRLAFRGGLVAAFPVFLISLYTLFSQWLPPATRTFLKIFVPSLILSFAAGVAFVYYVILPTSLEFLLAFGNDVAIPLISVTEYFELVVELMFWMGILFELPLAMYLLARLDLISYKRFKWARLAVWFAAPILAAIITPSFDVWTWMLVMVPLIVLYELGLFLAWAARPDDGNYLYLKSMWHSITWTLRRPVVAYRTAVGLPRRLLRR